MLLRNPVIPGFHPDPSITRVGEDYYLATSTFEYFPGVPIYHSRDLIHWRCIGHCLTRESQLDLKGKEASQGIYAPSLRYHNGRFYMITTLIPEVLNFFVWADDPASPWSEPVIVDQPGIDPSLLFDEDGKVYCTSQGPGGVIQSEIDIETGRRKTLWQPIWEGSGWVSPEGPHLYNVDGTYYLFVAEGGTQYGHMVTVARSDSPWGPFESYSENPILCHCTARGASTPINGTGHADLIQGHDSSWWAVFLAFRPVAGRFHHLGRETCLAPVTWQDGWPMIGEAGTIKPVMELEGLPPVPVPPEPTRDDFDGEALAPPWNFLRNPNEADWSLTDRPGFLRLKGSLITLDDVASPAWVGRRQQHLQSRATTRLDFTPTGEGEEAGLTIYMNNHHHYEIFLTLREGARVIVVRRRIGDLVSEVAQAPAPEGEVILKVISTESHYRLLFGPTEEDLQELASAEAKFLSSEVAGGWTGVYLAMFAQGDGGPCSAPADFDWFEYSEFYE
ncbi:MAG: glycoside hydrolase family 43 protein [Planctomycetota bacterium]|jgi:alpha-N-arabinofuranosidase